MAEADFCAATPIRLTWFVLVTAIVTVEQAAVYVHQPHGCPGPVDRYHDHPDGLQARPRRAPGDRPAAAVERVARGVPATGSRAAVLVQWTIEAGIRMPRPAMGS
jgi:hypothetical protein